MPKTDSARRRRGKRPVKKPVAFELSKREIAILQNWKSTLGLRPKLTAIVESCAMSTVGDRLAKGRYQAIKDGRSTLITTESILARRAKLPAAQYKSPVSP